MLRRARQPDRPLRPLQRGSRGIVLAPPVHRQAWGECV